MVDSCLMAVGLEYICLICKSDSLHRIQIGDFVFCQKCLGELLAKYVAPMKCVTEVRNTVIKESEK
jgi:hypothetical protein